VNVAIVAPLAPLCLSMADGTPFAWLRLVMLASLQLVAGSNDVEWTDPYAPVPARKGPVLVGAYRIIRPLANGGMGEVYVVEHERLPVRFALKLLHRDLLTDEDARSRFDAEVSVLANLRHPNIVQVFDFNLTADGRPYLVMELIAGKDLADHLAQRQPFAPARVAHIVRQIASALQLAHDQGVVHRDLKPENVMLVSHAGQEDFVKVIDFGISKASGSRRATAEPEILGTPQFMAPEQAQGRGEDIDHRADQFALGSLAYTLLTGREPFHADTALAVLYQVVHQQAAPLPAALAGPGGTVDSVLRQAMAKQREDRFPTILEFARRLEAAIRSSTPQ
jgi:serine/threonine-protein kinase